MSNTEQGSEETVQFPIDALSLDISPLVLIVFTKVTSVLGLECFSIDDSTVKVVDTLASRLDYKSLVETKAIVEFN